MKRINISGLDEVVYFEKLDNGLEVYLYTNEIFHSNYVTFTTKYGSIYNEFAALGETKMRSFPKGIAHFLEHKVFAVKDGPDPMEFFSRSGSVCNAYTTFKLTSFLFYATSRLKENICYLLDFVQDLYLTDESVENEKKIISEEIHMYDDRPSEVLAEKIRMNALHTNPYKDSIIGTTDDIEKITKEDLETAYKTFYHPSNMFLVVVGSFDPEEIIKEIKENQSKKTFEPFKKIEIKEFKEKDAVVKKEEVVDSTTIIPKVAVTIKFPLKDITLSRRKLSLYLYILFSSLFDETSDFDELLKKDNIITTSTYVSTLNCDTHMLVSIVNETKKYKEFISRVEDKLNNISISDVDFNRKKKVLKSNEIFAFEFAEQINDIISDDIIFEGKLETKRVEIIDGLCMKEMNYLIEKIDLNNVSKVILKNSDGSKK